MNNCCFSCEDSIGYTRYIMYSTWHMELTPHTQETSKPCLLIDSFKQHCRRFGGGFVNVDLRSVELLAMNELWWSLAPTHENIRGSWGLEAMLWFTGTCATVVGWSSSCTVKSWDLMRFAVFASGLMMRMRRRHHLVCHHHDLLAMGRFGEGGTGKLTVVLPT